MSTRPDICRTCGTRSGKSSPLPVDLDAELSMVGSVLLDVNELDETASIAGPDDCMSPEVAQTFRTMLELRNTGKPIDAATVRDRLIANGRTAEAADAFLVRAMESVPHAVHACHYAQTVRDRARRRAAALLGLNLDASARDLTEDVDEQLARSETELHRVIEARTQSRDLTVYSAVAEAMQALDSDAPAGLETGLPDLDRLTGGLQPGSLAIVGSRPSVGKTALLCSIDKHVASRGTPVLMFSLEQSRREIVERMICSVAQVSSEVWKRRVQPTTNERQEMDRAADLLTQWPVFIDDQPGQTLAQMRATARLCRRRHKVELVLIDYLQLVEPSDSKIPREQQIAQITRGLKLMARDLNVRVVLACQLNRELEKRTDRRPQLSDLRESGAIEQDADVVILLDGSKLHDHEPTGTLVLRVAKHRNGQRGDVDVILDRERMTIRSAAPVWMSEPFAKPEF